MIATHIGAYQHVKGIDVVAVCDTDETLMNNVRLKRGIEGKDIQIIARC